MTEIIIYEDPDVISSVQVMLEGETVWLTQAQMAELFGRERSVISRHLQNIFKEGELDREATRAKFTQVQNEGGRAVQRDIEHFNLDAIISVGYRVNSKRGVRFRQWATKILKDHLLHGYTLNQQRLTERGLGEAQAALDLLARTLESNALVSDTGQAVLAFISSYAKTWRLLVQYDEDQVPAQRPGPRPAQGCLAAHPAGSGYCSPSGHTRACQG